MPKLTDKQRLDYLELMASGIIEKKSTARGYHWTVHFNLMEKTPEFDSLRDAIDYLANKYPFLR